MAIITELTKCPICELSMEDDMENVIAFPADAIGPLSEFYRFYDGAAHRKCLTNWHRKEEFVKEWNEGVLRVIPPNESVLLSISEGGEVFFKNHPKY